MTAFLACPKRSRIAKPVSTGLPGLRAWPDAFAVQKSQFAEWRVGPIDNGNRFGSD
jgi:hypothetical protein